MAKKKMDLQEIDGILAAEGARRTRAGSFVSPALTVGSEFGGDTAQAELMAQTEAWSLERNHEKLLAIHDTRERIRQGAFGTCEECGSKIAKARLLADLTTRYCIRCQRLLERSAIRNERRTPRQPDFSGVDALEQGEPVDQMPLDLE